MNNPVIEKYTLDFLRKLAKNNNRDWFLANKPLYEKAKLNTETFVDALITTMHSHDDIDTENARKSLYRIYNDVRFSNDKAPYNPRFAGYLKRRKPHLRGGYYFWIKPGASKIACGFAYPNSADLRRIREDIDMDTAQWRKLLNLKSIRSHFEAMTGEQVSTAPRGFDRDHPAIDLLRFKQFWFERTFTDAEVLSPKFLAEINKSYKAIRPFFDHMSDILGSDANGEVLNR